MFLALIVSVFKAVVSTVFLLINFSCYLQSNQTKEKQKATIINALLIILETTTPRNAFQIKVRCYNIAFRKTTNVMYVLTLIKTSKALKVYGNETWRVASTSQKISIEIHRWQWWSNLTRELHHNFWTAAVLVRHLGFLDFCKTHKIVKSNQKLLKKKKYFRETQIVSRSEREEENRKHTNTIANKWNNASWTYVQQQRSINEANIYLRSQRLS